MPTAYRLTAGGKLSSEPAVLAKSDREILWIDSLSPTDAELNQLDQLMGFEVPNRHDITEIELSSRLYKEADAVVMVANLLPRAEGVIPPRPAAFILKQNVLLTIRYADFYSFDRVSQLIRAEREIPQTPVGVFCRLLEEAVADRADNIELSMRYMEDLTSRLFHRPGYGNGESETESPELDVALRLIGRMGENVSNIRESITSLQMAVNFASTYVPESWLGEDRMVLNSIKTDLMALSDEASFFMSKLSFNLDAVLGMINIDENKIIRLLSVVTVLFSPPMVIAGIYGMNFNIMPELQWKHGYLFSLALMALTMIVSVWYLKRKRWL